MSWVRRSPVAHPTSRLAKRLSSPRARRIPGAEPPRIQRDPIVTPLPLAVKAATSSVT